MTWVTLSRSQFNSSDHQYTQYKTYDPLTLCKKNDFNRIFSDMWQYLEPFNFVTLCWIELFETERFVHLTVCKQITDV